MTTEGGVRGGIFPVQFVSGKSTEHEIDLYGEAMDIAIQSIGMSNGFKDPNNKMSCCGETLPIAVGRSKTLTNAAAQRTSPYIG